MSKPKAKLGSAFFMAIALIVCYVIAFVFAVGSMFFLNVPGMIASGVLLGVFFELAMFFVDQWRNAAEVME